MRNLSALLKLGFFRRALRRDSIKAKTTDTGRPPLRFGVIGLGLSPGIGMSRAKLITQTEGALLVAVADLIPERREYAVKNFDCEAYEDYREMLSRDDIDIVLITVPSGLHANVGIEAARCGKHVIVTKPMDISLEKCDFLIKCCEENEVNLMVDLGERYREENRKIHRAIELGLLGQLILGELRLKWYRDDTYYKGWHGTWEMDGGGSLMNQGIHWIDLLQWFLGPAESVYGKMGIYAHKNVETEDLTTAIINFKNGALGTVLTTTTFPNGNIARIEIHGEKGAVATGKTELWDFIEEPPSIELPPCPGNVIEDAIQVLTEGKKPAVDGYEGRKSVELVLAIYRSAQTGKEVQLPLEP